MERSHKRKQTEVSEDSVESSSSAKRRRRMATSAPVRRTTTNSAADHMTPLETATSVIKLLRASFSEMAEDAADAEQEGRWLFQIFTSSSCPEPYQVKMDRDGELYVKGGRSRAVIVCFCQKALSLHYRTYDSSGHVGEPGAILGTSTEKVESVIRLLVDGRPLCDGLELTHEIEAGLRPSDKASIIRGDLPRCRSPLCESIVAEERIQKASRIECVKLRRNLIRGRVSKGGITPPKGSLF